MSEFIYINHYGPVCKSFKSNIRRRCARWTTDDADRHTDAVDDAAIGYRADPTSVFLSFRLRV